MRLSTRARYALRLMLDVARNGAKGKPVSLSSVAERTDLSRGYLEQLALSLRNARLLRGIAGRYGGYKLARTADDITIGEILEATIGPMCVVDCIEDPMGCPRAEFCECRIVYSIINNRIAEVLQEYTIADLLNPSWVHSQSIHLQVPGGDGCFAESNPGQGVGPGHRVGDGGGPKNG